MTVARSFKLGSHTKCGGIVLQELPESMESAFNGDLLKKSVVGGDTSWRA